MEIYRCTIRKSEACDAACLFLTLFKLWLGTHPENIHARALSIAWIGSISVCRYTDPRFGACRYKGCFNDQSRRILLSVPQHNLLYCIQSRQTSWCELHPDVRIYGSPMWKHAILGWLSLASSHTNQSSHTPVTLDLSGSGRCSHMPTHSRAHLFLAQESLPWPEGWDYSVLKTRIQVAYGMVPETVPHGELWCPLALSGPITST